MTTKNNSSIGLSEGNSRGRFDGTKIETSSVLRSGIGGAQIDCDSNEQNSAYTKDMVIAERIVDKEVFVPSTKEIEEVYEKTIVVPQTRTIEEGCMEKLTVTQKIIEVAKPHIVEKIVEVPEYEYREKIVSVLEKVRQERIQEVPVIEYQERITEVPKVVYKEVEVKVPEYEYVEVVTYKDVEVVTYEEEHVIKEIVKPVIVEKPTPKYHTVENFQRVDVNIPYPVEAVLEIHFELPQLNVKYRKIDFPVSVPKFVEIPIPQEYFPFGFASLAETQRQKLKALLGESSYKSKGVPQKHLLMLDHEIKGTKWDELFTNKPAEGTNEKPIDVGIFVDEAFKNGEYLVDLPSVKRRLRESRQNLRESREKIESEYLLKLEELRLEKEKMIEDLNKNSVSKRKASLNDAIERARAQASSNLIAAGLEPLEYLTDDVFEMKAMAEDQETNTSILSFVKSKHSESSVESECIERESTQERSGNSRKESMHQGPLRSTSVGDGGNRESSKRRRKKKRKSKSNSPTGTTRTRNEVAMIY